MLPEFVSVRANIDRPRHQPHQRLETSPTIFEEFAFENTNIDPWQTWEQCGGMSETERTYGRLQQELRGRHNSNDDITVCDHKQRQGRRQSCLFRYCSD